MNRLLALALGLVGGLLVVGCGDEDESVGCNSVNTGMHVCRMGDIPEEECTNSGGTVVSSCPDGAALECPVSVNGEPGMVYFYDQLLVDSAWHSGQDLCEMYSN